MRNASVGARRGAAACVFVLALCRCAAPPVDHSAVDFQTAARRMSDDLLAQFQAKNGGLGALGSAISQVASGGGRDSNSFVIDPFVDGDSGNVILASNAIAQIFQDEVAKSGHDYHVLTLSSATIRVSRYVVTGTVKYEAYPPTGAKLYHVYGTIVDATTGDVTASASNWISDPRINDTPTPFYKNSPMFLKDASVVLQIATSLAGPGAGIAKSFIKTLAAAATTSDGIAALEHADFRGAVRLFGASLLTEAGRTLKNYSGLYQAHYDSGDKPDAAQAFYKLFALAVENNNVKIKFLFAVGRTDFVADPALRSQYDLWLRQIGLYLFNNTQTCMEISGHSSHSGSAAYNHTLSLERAERIRNILVHAAPGLAPRLGAIGRGFDENIVGTGTDDDQDAVDRRVEFKPIACEM